MGNYKVIHEISLKLRSILWAGFDGDTDVTQHVPSIDAIVMTQPINVMPNERLSVWLYQVSENEFVKNQPMLRGRDDREEQFPPLVVNLLYLLTPFTGSVEGDQRVLGRAMQVLYDNARLVLPSAEDPAVADDLSIVLCRRTLEELTRIWDALKEPYRLSVCYEVRLGRIESRRTLRPERIADRQLDEAVRS